MVHVLRGRSRIAHRFLDRSLRCLILVLALSAFGAHDLCAQDVGARAIVSSFQDTLLATMKEAGPLGFEGRYQRLQPAMEAAFDLEQMTRIVVGTRWAKLGEAEHEQLVDLFRRFSVSTYAREFSGYGGEQFEIGDDRAQPGLGTIVETQLILKDDKPVALNYLLRQTPQGWRIVDVYLDGTISELARRRDEFSSIIRNQGVDGLIALLKKKNEELAGS
jgi:phospholipid transport system substrate-binding protein